MCVYVRCTIRCNCILRISIAWQTGFVIFRISQPYGNHIFVNRSIFKFSLLFFFLFGNFFDLSFDASIFFLTLNVKRNSFKHHSIVFVFFLHFFLSEAQIVCYSKRLLYQGRQKLLSTPFVFQCREHRPWIGMKFFANYPFLISLRFCTQCWEKKRRNRFKNAFSKQFFFFYPFFFFSFFFFLFSLSFCFCSSFR